MSPINEKLRSHVTSVAFHLTLKRTMIEAMQYIRLQTKLREMPGFVWTAQNHERAPTLYVTGFWALERRGLVEQVNTTGEDGLHDFQKFGAKLTPAGEHVWALLLMAGLVFDIVETEDSIRSTMERVS